MQPDWVNHIPLFFGCSRSCAHCFVRFVIIAGVFPSLLATLIKRSFVFMLHRGFRLMSLVPGSAASLYVAYSLA